MPLGRVRGLSGPSSLGDRNFIGWIFIEPHGQDLMQVAISSSEGRLSPVTLMRRLRSNSRNRTCKVFREVGRSVRTVAEGWLITPGANSEPCRRNCAAGDFT